VAAVIRPVPGKTVSIEELEAFVSKRVAHFKVPRYWRIVDELPLTGSGKVRKIELESLFEAGDATDRPGCS